jgi:hypothetical protein
VYLGDLGRSRHYGNVIFEHSWMLRCHWHTDLVYVSLSPWQSLDQDLRNTGQQSLAIPLKFSVGQVSCLVVAKGEKISWVYASGSSSWSTFSPDMLKKCRCHRSESFMCHS